MHIAAHLKSIGKSYSLRTWVDKNCPLEDYFEAVDECRNRIKRVQARGDKTEPSYGAIAVVLAGIIAGAAVLADYVTKKHDVNTAEEWEQIYLAAAWIILERYERAVDREEWRPA